MENKHQQNRFLDWGVALGGLWLLGGLHLDGWAHHRIAMESFFTPWHAVLYSGFFATASVVGLVFMQGMRQRPDWRFALSNAYRTSLFGALLFFFGGIADMAWHTLFGIEKTIEALLSPPHLLLALGAGLLITGPLRAALYRAGALRRARAPDQTSTPARPTPGLPALLSLANLIALIAFFTAYMHPFIEATQPVRQGSLAFRLVTEDPSQVVGAVLLQTILLMAAVLLLARSFRLPFGALTLLFGLTTSLAAVMHENWGLILVALLAGLAADALVLALRPGQADWHTRLFAFLVPAILYLTYFTALKLTGGFGWSFELWGGTTLLAGFAGWLLSYGFFAAREE